MQKDRARRLRDTAIQTANVFSIKDRGGNYDQEDFQVERILALGESTAAVVFLKTPTLKRAVAFYYFVNSRANPRWEYFFITYAHLASLEQLKTLLHEVEQLNFERNFDEGKKTEVGEVFQTGTEFGF